MLDYPVTLEVTENGVQQTVEGFCCGDRDRKRLRVSLLLHGGKIALSPYCAAVFTAVKPDGTEISHPCTVEDGDICYIPAVQTLALPGLLTCRVVVYGSDDSVLYAPQFAIAVERETVPTETIVSEDEHTFLPLHVLGEFADADGTLLYRDEFAGKVAVANTANDLPTGCTGQLAYVRNEADGHPRGFYRFGTQWEPLPTDTHQHANGALLDSMHAENGFLYCGETPVGSILIGQSTSSLPTNVPNGQLAFIQSSSRLMYRMNGNWYIIIQSHYHTNSDVLNKLSADADGLLFDGKPIRSTADEDDTLVPLALGTAYDLLLRENWYDVPVYVTDYIGYSIGLYCGTDFAQDDCVRLYDTQDYDTGLPVPLLRVRRSGAEYTCYPRTFHGLSQTFAAGWYDDEENAVSAPSLAGMTFSVLQASLDSYTSLDNLPAKAQSALETLSRIVNVSVEAMGGTGDIPGAVRRFAGTLEAGKHYAFGTDSSFTLTFPTVPWSETPHTARMDLYCAQDVHMTLPREKLLDGGTLPDTTAGFHALEFTFVPEAGKFSVGHTDRVTPQYWDDIPDEVIPLEDCTWAQIKSIAENGYRNRLGQWCIRRDNAEEVWFEVGDTKSVTLTTGETWPVQLWDFLHDDLADGSGKAPFTFGMAGVTAASYRMNNTNTKDGGWEACYFRNHTLPNILAALPDTLRSIIASVSKITTIAQSTANADNTRVNAETTDRLFLPTVKELSNGLNDGGTKYAIFDGVSPGVGTDYYLRSINAAGMYGGNRWSLCKANGATDPNSATTGDASALYKVRLAFCI